MKTKQQKQDSVASMTDKLSRAKSVVFADYQGITMSELSGLRKKLRDQQAEFSITKNTLLNLSLQATSYQLPASPATRLDTDNVLSGPVATLFSYEDEISPIKTLVKAFKDFNKGKVKGGFLDGEFLDQYKVISLSNLPSKLELQGKVVGVLAAPIQGIVSVLNANLRGLAYALDQIRIQKGGE